MELQTCSKCKQGYPTKSEHVCSSKVRLSCHQCGQTFAFPSAKSRHLNQGRCKGKIINTIPVITGPINAQNATTIIKECETVIRDCETVVSGYANIIKDCETVLKQEHHQVNTQINIYMIKHDDYCDALQRLHGMSTQEVAAYLINRIHSKTTFDIYKKLFLNGEPHEWAITPINAAARRFEMKRVGEPPFLDKDCSEIANRFARCMQDAVMRIVNGGLTGTIVDNDVDHDDFPNRAHLAMDEMQMDKLMSYATNVSSAKEKELFIRTLVHWMTNQLRG